MLNNVLFHNKKSPQSSVCKYANFKDSAITNGPTLSSFLRSRPFFGISKINLLHIQNYQRSKYLVLKNFNEKSVNGW